MALYQLKNPATFEAYPKDNGDYILMVEGLPQIVPKADFEAKYAPFVKQG
jgi:hypothetical protein